MTMTISDENIFNYKVIDLVEIYKLDIDYLSILGHLKILKISLFK